ncbi:MAG: glycosyltransferase family 39 protein [Chloroflexota bacterium]|nr:glycosyltransferase family 39 protein [Dehalococcoidia bacterium]MDW8253646.1 glycosyltransferase family 39 protein [Chloroflexota bacterium]
MAPAAPSSRSATRLLFPSQPRRLLAGIVAIVLAVAANARYLSQPPDLIAAGAAFLIAIALAQYALPATGPDGWESTGRWPRLTAALPSAFAGAAAFLFLGGSLWLFSSDRNPNLAWLLYLAAVAMTLGAAFLLPAGTRTPVSPPIGRAELAILALATAVGLWFRTAELATLPFGVWYDEAVVGLGAQQILASPTYRPIFYVENQNPAANIYLAALAMLVFGETPLALRVTTAIAGTVGIPAIYLLTRRLFGSPRIALIAAWFLAVSSWHVTLSRFPTSTAIFSITLETLVLFFLVRGLQDRRPRDFVIAGLLVGFDLQFYFPSRIFPVTLAVLLLAAALWRRSLWPSISQGALLLALAALIAAGPLAWFAVRFPEEFNRRLGVASVMPEVERAGHWGPLLDNIEKHLLMFNVAGDRNGRHNLPGRPMLDPLLAPLFVLGVGLTLGLLRRPTGPTLIIWWGTMLLGGILSLNFEAPQSLRASTALPPTLIFAALPLGALWDRWVRSPWGTYGNPAAAARSSRTPLSLGALLVGTFPRLPARWHGPSAWSRAWRAGGTIALGSALLFVAVVNHHRYFVAWANDFAAFAAHSAAETLVALRLRELSPNDAVYLSQFFSGRPPTIRFLAPKAPEGALFNAATDVPVRAVAPRTFFFLDPSEQAAFSQLRLYYPSAQVEELRPPFGGPPLVYAVQLAPADIVAIQGVEARYFAHGTERERPDLSRRETEINIDPATLGLAVPVLAEWRSTLHVPRHGSYRLLLEGPSSAELFLNGARVLTGGQAARLTLAAGNHALLLRARADRPGQPVRLAWEPPGGTLSPIPSNLFYLPPVAATGLLGAYYPNAEWAGEPALLRIDPQIGMYFHILPLPRPYSVEWRGTLRIDQPGVYRFGTEQISTSQLFLNGRLIIDNRRGSELHEVDVPLEAGLHDLQLKFVDRDPYSRIYLYWTPPGRRRELIPSAVLLPPQGSDLPPSPTVPAAPREAAVRVPSGVVRFASGPPLSLRVEMTYGLSPEGRLEEPRAAALDPTGALHVLDGGARRVLVFDPQGQFIRAYAGPEPTAGGLQEPTGIAITRSGRVFILDATTAGIHEYRLDDGRFVGRLPLARSDFYKPRGLSIDEADNLYISDTGQNRVLKFASDGQLLTIYGGRKGAGPGEMLEPTDAALLPTGDLLVLDTGNKRLQWFDPGGRYQAEWPINWSVPLNGPHLVLDAASRPVVTDPDRGRLVRYDVREGVQQVGGAPGLFTLPVEIVAADDGRFYVVDTGGRKVVRIVIEN